MVGKRDIPAQLGRLALTLRPAAFYIASVRFEAGPYGGTGRRVRLKIGFRKECWFDSG